MTPASPMATDPRLEAAKDEITKLLTERREQDREVRRLSLPSFTEFGPTRSFSQRGKGSAIEAVGLPNLT